MDNLSSHFQNRPPSFSYSKIIHSRYSRLICLFCTSNSQIFIIMNNKHIEMENIRPKSFSYPLNSIQFHFIITYSDSGQQQQQHEKRKHKKSTENIPLWNAWYVRLNSEDMSCLSACAHCSVQSRKCREQGRVYSSIHWVVVHGTWHSGKGTAKPKTKEQPNEWENTKEGSVAHRAANSILWICCKRPGWTGPAIHMHIATMWMCVHVIGADVYSLCLISFVASAHVYDRNAAICTGQPQMLKWSWNMNVYCQYQSDWITIHRKLEIQRNS